MLDRLMLFFTNSGIAQMSWQSAVMLVAAGTLLYLAIKKGYEPLLLIPIGFGMLLSNIPASGVMDPGGLLRVLYVGIETGLYPPLIFIGVGAMTDFSALIANPRSFLLGAAAQFGIFGAFLGALATLRFTLPQAAAIGIIGGADGPTAIFLTSQLAPELLATIAIAAYSYMALVPMIQPVVIKALTTPEERKIRMEQLRPVTKAERIGFPIMVTLVGSLLIPSATPLLGALMFGNLMREVGVVDRLSKTAQNEMINVVTIFLGLTVGATARAETFIQLETLIIIGLGLVAFVVGTATGVIFGKLMCKLTGGKVNPIIGAAGVSAVPMAARVCQKVGQEADPENFLLMHAMGPNVAGVIGSAAAAGIFLALLA